MVLSEKGPRLDVTLLVDEQVLRLEVSVDEVQRVKVFKGQYDLGCVEAGVRFTAKPGAENSQLKEEKKSRWTPETRVQVSSPESTDSPQVREHLPPGDVLHDHVQVAVVLQSRQDGETQSDSSCKRGRVRRLDEAAGSNLEGVFQSHQEGEVDRLQDPLLIQRVFYLLQLHHLERRREEGVGSVGDEPPIKPHGS